MEYHKPVLLEEAIDGLNIKPDGVYIDVTFGGGGHSREILKRLGANGQLIAFDQDKDALENTISDKRFMLINENFRYIKRFLRFYKINHVDGILADFGVSSHQFDIPERGFSTRFDSELDMRMNQNNNISAFEIINEYEERQLADVLKEYGELRQARGMAREITQQRKSGVIKTGNQLRDAISRFLSPKYENKILAQVYQAIRIEVNQELEALKEFLLQTEEILHPGGRLCCISYHSLEDRLVKRFIRNGMFEGEPERDVFGQFNVPFKKVDKLIVPSKEEIAENNRARSAKLRIAERI